LVWNFENDTYFYARIIPLKSVLHTHTHTPFEMASVVGEKVNWGCAVYVGHELSASTLSEALLFHSCTQLNRN